MITIQETNKKHIIRALKRSPNYYIDFRKRYYRYDNYKFFYNALFNSFNPSLSLKIMYRNNMIQRPIFDIIKNNIVSSMSDYKIYSIFKNCIDLTFRAANDKDKQKLYNFCIKYGIIPENYSSELEKFIKNYNYFRINEYMELEDHILPSTFIPLYSFINKFEDSAYMANGIKINFFKRLIEKLKIKYK